MEHKANRPSAKARFHSFWHGEHTVSKPTAWLIFAIYALLLLSRLIDTFFLTRENQYLSTVLLQLLIFPIPAYLYIRLRGDALKGKLALKPPSLSHLFLLLSAILMLISGCTLLGLICGMMNAQPSFTLYDTFSSIHDGTASATVRLILAYGILPAFCEELIFRSILCAEYEKHGILYASLLSSLFFALLHFDLTALPVYLFAGVLLAAVRYVSRSGIASMIVHLGYNLFGIFLQAGLSGYCRSTGSIGLLVILLISLLLLSSAFFCGEVSRILKRRGARDLLDDPAALSTPGLNRIPLRGWPSALLHAFTYPPAVGALLLWMLGVVLHIIR
ncbi:MAG: CPBP family intramembrane metalloprotease [Clostridia bacterium]|nr:CPBP family intramembrane metalloprotease [Clostridia bacterium]